MKQRRRATISLLAEALRARESLNEQEILEVTGLKLASALETGLLPVAGAGNEGARSHKAAPSQEVAKC